MWLRFTAIISGCKYWILKDIYNTLSFYYKEGKGKRGEIGSNTIIGLNNDSTAESVPFFRLEFQDVHVSIYDTMINHCIKSVAMQGT